MAVCRPVSTRRLELIGWLCTGVCLAIVAGHLWFPSLALWKGGWGVLLFFVFMIVGFPAAMISLHLHGPKWFGSRKRK